MSSHMVANTNHTALLKNQHALKYLSCMHFLSNFRCKIIFMCSINFQHQQDSNSLFKERIGHMTSQYKLQWPVRSQSQQKQDEDFHMYSCKHVVNNYKTPHHHCRILNPILRTPSIKAQISTCPLTHVFLLSSLGLIFFCCERHWIFQCHELLSARFKKSFISLHHPINLRRH